MAYRMQQKGRTAPKINVTTGKPLPIEQQPDSVVAANPHLVVTADGQREAAVRRVATTLGIDPAAMLDSQSFMARVAATDPADVPAMTAAISEGILEQPGLVQLAMALPGAGLKPNPAQGSSSQPPPAEPIDLKSRMAAKAKTMASGDARSTSGGVRRIV
jgi:hypothetical protein